MDDQRTNFGVLYLLLAMVTALNLYVFYYKNSKVNHFLKYDKLKPYLVKYIIFFFLFGTFCWVEAELFCDPQNYLMVLLHPFWHIGMSTGIYLLLYYVSVEIDDVKGRLSLSIYEKDYKYFYQYVLYDLKQFYTCQ
jgi:hypothetical protein